MKEIASRVNAMDQGVRERDAGCNVNTMIRQSVARPVWQREWHEDEEHQHHRKMLARVKKYVGDVDKLLAEYEPHIGIESGRPGKCNQELKDRVSEPRRI